MSDDATAGHWEPPADQPITPAQPPPPSWVAPAYGPPPSSEASSSEPVAPASEPVAPASDVDDAPSTTTAIDPPPAGFVYPAGAQNTYRVDYLESPPKRRRSPAMFVAIGLVLLIVIGVGGGLISTGSGHSSAGVAGVASASASSHPQDSTKPSPATTQNAGPSPNASAPNAPAPSTQVGPLDANLLPPSAEGGGTLMALIPGGRSVTDQATLDFCNYDYTSESLRDARVQVQYVSGAALASNEFVRYGSGGAAAAFSEIKKAIAGCPSSYNESGGEVSGIHRLTGLTGLAKDSAAVSFTSTFTGPGGVEHQATTVVYQFDGDFFSGVYVYGTDATTVQAAAAKLAATSAKLLAEAATGKPGTGGGPLTSAPSGAPGVQA
jgi:hypothetical protein